MTWAASEAASWEGSFSGLNSNQLSGFGLNSNQLKNWDMSAALDSPDFQMVIQDEHTDESDDDDDEDLTELWATVKKSQDLNGRASFNEAVQNFLQGHMGKNADEVEPEDLPVPDWPPAPQEMPDLTPP